MVVSGSHGTSAAQVLADRNGLHVQSPGGHGIPCSIRCLVFVRATGS